MRTGTGSVTNLIRTVEIRSTRLSRSPGRLYRGSQFGSYDFLETSSMCPSVHHVYLGGLTKAQGKLMFGFRTAAAELPEILPEQGVLSRLPIETPY
eukprot:SAG11_NODE_429_length_9534_cov_14.689242_1_plen_96_part_00